MNFETFEDEVLWKIKILLWIHDMGLPVYCCAWLRHGPMVRIYYILRQNVDTNVFSASVNIFIFVPGPIQNLTWLNLKT